MSITERTWIVGNDLACIASATASVREYLEEQCAEMSERFFLEVSLAVEEALTNAVVHGNLEISSQDRDDQEAFFQLIAERGQQSPYSDRRVRFETRVLSDSIELIVVDEGNGFVHDQDAAQSDDEIAKCHGRGLLLINSFADEVRFNAKGNEIRIVKFRSCSADRAT